MSHARFVDTGFFLSIFLSLRTIFRLVAPFTTKSTLISGYSLLDLVREFFPPCFIFFFSSLSIICSFKLQMMLIWNTCHYFKSLNCAMLRRHLWRQSCSYMQQYNHKMVVLFWKWVQKNLNLNFILDLFIKIVQILILVHALTHLASLGSHTLGSLYESNALFFQSTSQNNHALIIFEPVLYFFEQARLNMIKSLPFYIFFKRLHHTYVFYLSQQPQDQFELGNP